MKGIQYAADSVRLKFVTISCRQCGYTELYRAQTGTGMNVLDFLVG